MDYFDEKKNKKNNSKNNKVQKKKYSSPFQTIWGKAIIISLSLLMVAGILASLIYALVKMGQNV